MALSWEGREPITFVCAACGKMFEGYFEGRTRYCSSACAQRVAYRRYFTDPRTCEHCGQTFTANRHRPTRYCSRRCSNRARASVLSGL